VDKEECAAAARRWQCHEVPFTGMRAVHGTAWNRSGSGVWLIAGLRAALFAVNAPGTAQRSAAADSDASTSASDCAEGRYGARGAMFLQCAAYAHRSRSFPQLP